MNRRKVVSGLLTCIVGAMSLAGCGGSSTSPASRDAGQWVGAWSNAATNTGGKAQMAVTAGEFPQESADCTCSYANGTVLEIQVAWNDRQGSSAPIIESALVRASDGAYYTPTFQSFGVAQPPDPQAGRFIIQFTAASGLTGEYTVNLARP